MTWMLYGANGYTGRLVANLAVQRGHRPILAGRTAASIAPLAGQLGLEHRTFELADARPQLRDVAVVVHCAGPFAATYRPMVDACLATGTHYIDITGEIDVFEAIALEDAEARQRGVVLLPGVGFDVVPTDCVAAMLASELPGATHLDLAFVAAGGMSPGTVKTTAAGVSAGGRIREDGRLKTVRIGHRERTAGFRHSPMAVGSVPWGDVSTAYRSTGIPNITAFTIMPGPAGTGLLADGPDAQTRGSTTCEVWGEVWNDERRVSLTLTGPNGYDLTADAVIRAVEKIGGVPPGSHTPSTAFGADFVRELDGVVVGDPIAGS